MSEQKPSVGRIVHYVSQGSPVLPDGSQVYPSVCRAAIVTHVDEYQDSAPDQPMCGHIGLAVLSPQGAYFNNAFQDETEKRGGTWHWPERV